MRDIESRWLSINDTMRTLGVSRQTIYNLIAEGKLQRVNLGRRAFITRASMSTLIKQVES